MLLTDVRLEDWLKQPDEALLPYKPRETRLFKRPSGLITSILTVLSGNTGNITVRGLIFPVLSDRTINIEVITPLGHLNSLV